MIQSISYESILLEDETGGMLIRYTRLHSLKQNFLYKQKNWKKKKKAIWDILVSFILKLKYSQSSRFWEDAREEEEQLHSSD